ncbi:MAG: MtrB/PioB family decaheme-associated outer membrane protein [Betaproteobacteria bacterium]
MKADTRNLALNMLTLAVKGAIAAMMAFPALALAEGDDDDIAALTKPTNSIEIGTRNTSQSSAKFGEYNGLDKKGGSLIGNFNVRGGDAYENEGGTVRWNASGANLGTTSRSLNTGVSDQGRWNLGINYDELRHNITDSYQTPFQGSMGGNNFNLPSSFGVVNTTSPGTRALTTNQQASFQNEGVHSDRKNSTFSAGYNFDTRWSTSFEFNRLEQSGAKLIAASSDGATLGGNSYTKEGIAILMNPTNYKTDTYNLALNWLGDKNHFTASYYGSMFRDGYTNLSWADPLQSTSASGTSPGASGFFINSMSTPPSNSFHQLNLTGGAALTSTTKLAGGFSYGRNTQNESYSGTYTPGTMTSLPTGSLNGLVVSTHANLKLTNQTTKDLVLFASMKFNERNNQTTSNTFSFVDLGGVTRNSVNTPMSNKKTQIEFAGDYRIDKKQTVHFGYEYEEVKRWCNNSLANNAQGSAAPVGYYTTASCAQVPESNENKLALTYRVKASDDITLNAGYTYGRRRADINSSFYNPMQAVNQGFENFGYVAFFDASRKESLYKLGASWQASERLNLGLNGRFRQDKYDSTLGVQDGSSTSINLDASYTLSENSMVSAYYSWQAKQRNLLSEAGRSTTVILPTTTTSGLWTNQMSNTDHTVGLNGKQKGLMGGKLDLSEDLTYSYGKAGYSTQTQYPVTTCTDASNASCGATPDITSKMIQFRFTGSYKIDKVSKVVMGYMYQNLRSNDYFYNAYQYGYTPATMLPTNQTAPNYSVNTVFAMYNYTFQ